MHNPFEGQTPEEKRYIGIGLTSYRFPGWKSRHPETADEDWTAFPDAVKFGNLFIPRYMKMSEITMDVLRREGLAHGVDNVMTLFAIDGNLEKLFIH